MTNWLRENRLMVVVASIALVVVVAAVTAVLLTGDGDGPSTDEAATPDEEPVPPEEEEVEPEPEPDPVRLPLTGALVDEELDRPAMIVKVSNSPEARPQSGLADADVVIEELTEGGITRFMAIFHSQLPEVAGPVRSARPVDVQLLSGFGRPGFAYSGARREVRNLLAGSPGTLITEGDAGFFRDDGAYASHPFAPHDLFVELEPALRAATDGGAQPLDDLGWAFSEEIPDVDMDVDEEGNTRDGTAVQIEMSRAFRTSWSYDEEAGVYRRSQNDADFTVTGDARIGAANVVVLAVEHYIGGSGYPETSVVGEGDAVVFRDGNRYPARWSKPSETAPMRVLTADGSEPFPFKPGPTWFHLPDRLPD
jgi:hypothetical protein